MELVAAKPFSLVYRAADKASYFKIYRGITPAARRDREVGGLALAARLGISAPAVRSTGQTEIGPWVEVRTVPGRPCAIKSRGSLESYVDSVLTTTNLLHLPAPSAPASAHRTQLLGQLTSRCQRFPWWEPLHAALADLGGAPGVHLHGDLKPEHLFVEGNHLSVIDWESSTTGPAARDQADAVFHVIRDLPFGGISPQ
ncbi:phosphotransferase [Streptomyces sp. S1D4-11]|nr:phosphotransferase [Streptomyces sp. S1D4-11]QIY94492.1 phosphotransferase [Streptomyces sp. S1D4-11]